MVCSHLRFIFYSGRAKYKHGIYGYVFPLLFHIAAMCTDVNVNVSVCNGN